MKSIVFYDGICPKPYDVNTAETEGMGGTEATVIRIAEALQSTGLFNVTVKQRGRLASGFTHSGVVYAPLDSPRGLDAEYVITLRDAGHYLTNKKLYSNRTKHYLWLHDMPTGLYREHLLGHLENEEANIIAVSDYHKHVIIDNLYHTMLKGNISVRRIYNPIADYCVKDTTPVDKNQLVFFSSPHKGLDQVLRLFEMIRRLDPEMLLSIANPGYYTDKKELPTGVTSVGSLPHKDAVNLVRGALATFYPNTTFPETFGLVYAESDAVGTPVIAHPIGAAREVLFHPKEVLDCRDYKEVVNRVLAWKNGERPVVQAKQEFKLINVIAQWKKVLE